MVSKFQKQLRWIDVGLGFQKDTRLKKVMVGRNVLPVFPFSFFFFLIGITMEFHRKGQHRNKSCNMSRTKPNLTYGRVSSTQT